VFIYISIRGEEGGEDVALVGGGVGGGGGVVLKGGAAAVKLRSRLRERGSGSCSGFIQGTGWCRCWWHGCERWEKFEEYFFGCLSDQTLKRKYP
jgi:hypothetical protein